MYHSTYKPWRRLPLWLIIRATLQTTLENVEYKSFVLLFLSGFLSDCSKYESHFPSDLLHVMRGKIARRLAKLRGRCPDFVLEAAEKSSKATDDILQRRWDRVQASRRRQARWLYPQQSSNPKADTRLPLRRLGVHKLVLKKNSHGFDDMLVCYMLQRLKVCTLCGWLVT